MKKTRTKDIIGFFIGLGILLLLNMISSVAFKRFDLTTENRYSISEPTKQLIENLENDVYITVYLEGDFPASFKRLRNETKEMLDEFQAYSNGKVDFEFINPSSAVDKEEREETYRNLYKKGLRPTDLNIKDEDGVSQKIVWPGAIISYGEVQIAVQLLKSQFGGQPELILNQSIESLEYELAFGIKKASTPVVQSIAFVEGHGELNKYETADIMGSLREYYNVERIAINGNVNSLQERIYTNKDSTNAIVQKRFDAIVIAAPDSSFNEKDKFIIDQYLMYGGKVIWLIDQVFADMDSLNSQYNNNTVLATSKNLNLDDQLFNYGVRFNKDLVMDLRSAPIPVVNGQYGNQVKTKLFPWPYFPFLFSKNDHPINKNLDVVKAEFMGSIDLVGKSDLKKTVLLSTSETTKIVKSPTRVSLNMLSFEPPVEQYNKKDIPLAVLVEGEFESVFKNRLTPNITQSKQIKFKEKSDSTQQLFISDGDLIKNEFDEASNQFFALGFDKYTKQVYGNKSFFINAINYMVDESGLILSNNKSFKIRLLNTQKIKEDRIQIQIITTLVPILLTILIGLIVHAIRKKKYTRN
ncbi:MAG: ABC-2 type transport system permease protein [Vicingaceae bacterium]|jgi:ABC-2 type transport system permease protein